jgi:hypothetical protein
MLIHTRQRSRDGPAMTRTTASIRLQPGERGVCVTDALGRAGAPTFIRATTPTAVNAAAGSDVPIGAERRADPPPVHLPAGRVTASHRRAS